MRKFETYEQYLEQGKDLAAARERYNKKVEAAQQSITEAKSKLDEIIQAEMLSGVEKKAEKTAARKAIQQAEADLAYAEEERTIAHSHFSGPGGTITKSEIVQSYLNDYVPTVKSEHLPSIQQRMKQGADLILSAFHDFNSLKRDYRDIQMEIHEINDIAAKSGNQPCFYNIVNPFGDQADSGIDINKLAHQLQDIDGGAKLPSTATYIELPFENTGGK